MERGALRRLPEIIAELGAFHRLVMVCDDNTYAAAGNAIRDIFRSHPAFRLQIICLPTPPRGTPRHRDRDREGHVRHGALRPSAGRGRRYHSRYTRYAATQRGLDFLSVPTAASVDGFLSSIAAMTYGGVKRSFPAKPPVALVADSDVLAAAPYALPTGGEIRALLSHMGAKVTWEDLGISQATGEALYEAAPFVRRRLTLMRLYKLISRS